MSKPGRVLGAQDYAVGSQPYLVQQVAEAAMEELKRRREAVQQRSLDAAADADPKLKRQREEADSLQAQAAKRLREAEEQAQVILQEAQARAESMQAEAREQGFLEGKVAGEAAGAETGEIKGEATALARHQEALDALGRLLEGFKAEKAAYFKDREAVLVELALGVAAKVIQREVETRPDHALNLVREACRRLSERSRLLVSLHPSDLERLQGLAAADLGLGGVKQIEFLADEKMVPGGARIQSGAQTLDAALDSQLAEIARGLLEEAYREG